MVDIELYLRRKLRMEKTNLTNLTVKEKLNSVVSKKAKKIPYLEKRNFDKFRVRDNKK